MTIKDTYSSWTRNRLTPALRERIASAGDGEVRYGPAVGWPRGYVSCRIYRDGEVAGVGVGASPEGAFHAALAGLPRIVSVLTGPAA